jgi:uncharacterized membrane protein
MAWRVPCQSVNKGFMTAPRHIRFVIAFGCSLLAGGLAWAAGLPLTQIVLIAADSCFALYLGLELRLAAHLTPDNLRKRAEAEDEGLPLILLLALATILTSLTAIFQVLNTGAGGWPEAALALATIPLGWAVLHSMVAFHYAYLYYAPFRKADAAGIDFPATAEPGMTEFLYFSFTIGMTAQVSDATISRSALRKAVLIHAVGSFFYNTCILALAVSAALTLGR